MLIQFKNFLSPQSKLNLSETYILSQFNYGDIILQGQSNQLAQKIQKIQNSCIRYSFGLRKFDHISNIRKSNNILCMKDRRLLHCLTLVFKITKNIAPIYLSDRINYRNSLHNYNTRRRNEIITPLARSSIRSKSFFVDVINHFNEFSRVIDVSNLSIATFRDKCVKYLLALES